VIERFFLATNHRKTAIKKYMEPEIKRSLNLRLEIDNANKVG
jgi:hypothetical protein